MINQNEIEAILERYVKQDYIVSFGTGPTNEDFLKKLALYTIESGLRIKIVPTAHSMALLANQLGIPITSLDEEEIDLAFDFVDQVDDDFNYISNETTSLIRDKMIAQDAAEMVVVCEEKEFVKKLTWPISVEVSSFAINKTIAHLMNIGEVKLREFQEKPVLSETGNYFVDINPDELYSIEDLEYQSKQIPGVLETSLFIGCADRAVLHGNQLLVKSRVNTQE